MSHSFYPEYQYEYRNFFDFNLKYSLDSIHLCRRRILELSCEHLNDVCCDYKVDLWKIESGTVIGISSRIHFTIMQNS